MSSKRVLIAEDDATIRLLEKRILEHAGYEVDCAENGKDALELLNIQQYCVVVADVMMPVLDGYALAKEIKKRFNKSLPVVLVTAVPDAMKAAHEHDAKPLSVLQKPFTPEALLTAVKLLESLNAPQNALPTKAKTAPKSPPKTWLDKLLHPTRQ